MILEEKNTLCHDSGENYSAEINIYFSTSEGDGAGIGDGGGTNGGQGYGSGRSNAEFAGGFGGEGCFVSFEDIVNR